MDEYLKSVLDIHSTSRKQDNNKNGMTFTRLCAVTTKPVKHVLLASALPQSVVLSFRLSVCTPDPVRLFSYNQTSILHLNGLAGYS